MKLFGKCEIISPYPALYIENLKSLVIADLHLGFEGISASKGVFIPKIQYKEIIQDLKDIFEKKKDLEKVIINGDVKHEFSKTSYHEYKEVFDLLSFLSKRVKEIIIIKGNHDNYIEKVTCKFEKVKVFKEYKEKEFYFVHGHRKLNLESLKNKILILAHEHPAIALYEKNLRIKEKIPCFLYGEDKGLKIIVLPAFSKLFLGTEINLTPKEELLSPILRALDIKNFEVVGIDRDIGILKFPKLGKLSI